MRSQIYPATGEGAPVASGKRGLVYQGKPAFTSRGCGKRFPAFDLEALYGLRAGGVPVSRMEVGWKCASSVKAFSRAPPRRCRSPRSALGMGGWEGICLHLLQLFPAPCQAGILLLLLLLGTWALLRVFLCSAPEPCVAFNTPWLCQYPHGSADTPPGSQPAPPALPGSSTGTGLTHWDNLAQPVITSVLVPFVTTGSVQRPLPFPASPPIASLHELHFDL